MNFPPARRTAKFRQTDMLHRLRSVRVYRFLSTEALRSSAEPTQSAQPQLKYFTRAFAPIEMTRRRTRREQEEREAAADQQRILVEKDCRSLASLIAMRAMASAKFTYGTSNYQDEAVDIIQKELHDLGWLVERQGSFLHIQSPPTPIEMGP